MRIVLNYTFEKKYFLCKRYGINVKKNLIFIIHLSFKSNVIDNFYQDSDSHSAHENAIPFSNNKISMIYFIGSIL